MLSSSKSNPHSLQSCSPTHPPVEETPHAIACIIADIRTLQNGGSLSTEPWITYALTPEQYTKLIHHARDDSSLWEYMNHKLKYNYIPALKRLELRMHTKLHELIIALTVWEVTRQLRELSTGNDTSATFARDIGPCGSATIDLTDAGYGKHDPDAQFLHLHAKYPAVVLEVSYSQRRKDIPYIADDYILGSNGNIKRVIGIDIGYPPSKKATLSAWKPGFDFNEAGELELFAKQYIFDMIIRDEEGRPGSNRDAGLFFKLQDFYIKPLSGRSERFTGRVHVSINELFSYLTEAEEIHQTQGAVRKDIPLVRIRPREKTPAEELHIDREVGYQNAEEEVMAQAEADDSSYKASSGDE